MTDGVWNTDDAPAIDVLRMLSLCAGSWEPDARLLGNVRACDIVRACNAVVELLSTDGEGAQSGPLESQGTKEG